MTYSPTTPGYTGIGQALKRPVTLLILQIVAGLSALLPIVAGILNLSGGHQLAEDELVNNVERLKPDLWSGAGLSRDAFVALMRSTGQWDSLVGEFQSAMAVWAGIEIGFGIMVLVWTIFGRTIWARVLLTVFSALAVIVHFAAIGTSAMGSDTVGPWLMIAWFFSLLTLVFCWLPPINRYARAVKLAR
jgi:hypothetical protein